MRVVLAALAGYASWSALWLGGHAAIQSHEPWAMVEGEPYMQTTPLLVALGLSLACSLVGGLCAAAVAPEARRPVLFLLALALVSTGAAVQAQVWSLMPLWYHLTFMLLLIPATLAGGRWDRGGHGAAG